MVYKQIIVDSVLKQITKKDELFNGNYTFDPYQNCEFGCLYCDSSLDKTIYIKTNAIELFKKDLNKLKKGTVVIGSVNDPYQNAEKNFEITRNILEILKQNNFSCHILTKSELVLRDIDILSKISNCYITISIISIKNSITNIFEKNAPTTKNRLKIIKKLSDKGIKTGLAIIPILPYLVEEEFENIVKSAKKYKAQYILFKPLELKGEQKKIYMNVLKNHRKELIDRYQKLYKNSYLPDDEYILQINKTLEELCQIYNLNIGIINK